MQIRGIFVKVVYDSWTSLGCCPNLNSHRPRRKESELSQSMWTPQKTADSKKKKKSVSVKRDVVAIEEFVTTIRKYGVEQVEFSKEWCAGDFV